MYTDALQFSIFISQCNAILLILYSISIVSEASILIEMVDIKDYKEKRGMRGRLVFVEMYYSYSLFNHHKFVSMS